ncbi:CubicO group peptidase, beta-lactamase class C family [Robiginitalea myxolifaciens]|uniref:CubicO group peptidase, beta-lactamase class C family n=1 Tax=Robiginitalea myxolifaciens TaxID=400055 RepID=A0A1I6H5Y7_9FLAO|nr:serine hydrolase domain-containing protein [Robiginitalea myxolifaciens]SFR49824.1 CubicO group peptidase, beta-lactamase class C family [Robiginitalea myxolifaciens]
MKNLLLIPLGTFLLLSCNNSEKKDNALLDERISKIENGLESNLQIQYGDSLIKSVYNLEDRMRELKIPGLSIAVLNDGEIEWARGYGIADSLEDRKVDTETLFQAGSISKPIAATRALQLSEQGLLDLDENINTYLTSWKLPDNEFTRSEKVTTRRILNHTAGLSVWGFPGYARGETIPSIPDILDGKGNTDSVRVFKEPGESWRYSGGGYTIMQQLIADLENESFDVILRNEVLNPLKMQFSTYENPLPEKYHSIAASGYREDGTIVDGQWHIYPEMAAAGLWTTPSELLLWAQEVQKILMTQEAGLLDVETINEMLTPNEDSQGLGPYVLDLTFGHGGADEGFRAELLVWKETANAVAVMVNSDQGSTIIRELLLSVVREYGLPEYAPRKRIFKRQSHDSLSRFTGKYDFNDSGQARIVVRDDGLEVTGDLFSDVIFLWPEADSTFFNKETGTRYHFILKDNKAVGLKFSRLEGEKID